MMRFPGPCSILVPRPHGLRRLLQGFPTVSFCVGWAARPPSFSRLAVASLRWSRKVHSRCPVRSDTIPTGWVFTNVSSNLAAKWNVPILRVQVQVPYGYGSKPNNILSHQKHGCTARYPLPQFKSGSVEQSSSPQNRMLPKKLILPVKICVVVAL